MDKIDVKTVALKRPSFPDRIKLFGLGEDLTNGNYRRVDLCIDAACLGLFLKWPADLDQDEMEQINAIGQTDLIKLGGKALIEFGNPATG